MSKASPIWGLGNPEQPIDPVMIPQVSVVDNTIQVSGITSQTIGDVSNPQGAIVSLPSSPQSPIWFPNPDYVSNPVSVGSNPLPPADNTPEWIRPIVNIINPSPVESNPLPSDNISSFKPDDFVSGNTGKTSSGFVGLFGMPQGKTSPASPQGIPTQILLIVGGLMLTIVLVSFFRR